MTKFLCTGFEKVKVGLRTHPLFEESREAYEMVNLETGEILHKDVGGWTVHYLDASRRPVTERAQQVSQFLVMGGKWNDSLLLPDEEIQDIVEQSYVPIYLGILALVLFIVFFTGHALFGAWFVTVATIVILSILLILAVIIIAKSRKRKLKNEKDNQKNVICCLYWRFLPLFLYYNPLGDMLSCISIFRDTIETLRSTD